MRDIPYSLASLVLGASDICQHFGNIAVCWSYGGIPALLPIQNAKWAYINTNLCNFERLTQLPNNSRFKEGCGKRTTPCCWSGTQGCCPSAYHTLGIIGRDSSRPILILPLSAGVQSFWNVVCLILQFDPFLSCFYHFEVKSPHFTSIHWRFSQGLTTRIDETWSRIHSLCYWPFVGDMRTWLSLCR